MNNLWTGLVLPVVVVIIAMIAGILVAISVVDDGDRPMACGEHQVLVWDNFPQTAHCVDDTAHDQHGGH